MSEYIQQCIIAAIYNLTILFLCTTLVLFYGFSPWWYVGAIILFAQPKDDKKIKKSLDFNSDQRYNYCID